MDVEELATMDENGDYLAEWSAKIKRLVCAECCRLGESIGCESVAFGRMVVEKIEIGVWSDDRDRCKTRSGKVK